MSGVGILHYRNGDVKLIINDDELRITHHEAEMLKDCLNTGLLTKEVKRSER